MKKLSNKVALITGAGSGIGEDAAKAFAHEGARVVVAGRRLETVERVVIDILNAGGDAIAVNGDMEHESEIAAMVNAAISHYGRIDVLFNNAGLTSQEVMQRDRDVVSMDAEVWDRVLRVNLRGPALMAKYTIPHMIRQGGGSIITSGSARYFQGDTDYTAYAASKAGLVSLNQNIAAQYGKQGVRANILVIGMILSEAAASAFPEPLRSVMADNHLTPFLGQPSDVSGAAVFLASDDSRFITGQQLFVDGGITSHSAAFAEVRKLTTPGQ